MRTVALMLLAVCAVLAQQDGVDVSVAVSSSVASCLARSYQFAIVRCYHSSARVDTNCAASVRNLRAAGMQAVDGYMFITSLRKTPTQQMSEMAQYIRANNVQLGRVWLDIEQARPYWGSQSSNENFIRGLISAGQSLGLRLGVYSNIEQWTEIVGHSGAGPWSALPLWYPRYVRTGRRSLADFIPFAGWTRPIAHQYSETGSGCGIGFDLNWSPNFEELAVSPTTPRAPTGTTPTGTGEPCSVSGASGTCQDVSACNGVSTPGFCPGPRQIQCCTSSAGNEQPFQQPFQPPVQQPFQPPVQQPFEQPQPQPFEQPQPQAQPNPFTDMFSRIGF